METCVSTKGHIVLPGHLRRRLEICAGDPLHMIIIEAEPIVVTIRPKRVHTGKIVADPVTGLPVLSTKEVDEILFPRPLKPCPQANGFFKACQETMK